MNSALPVKINTNWVHLLCAAMRGGAYKGLSGNAFFVLMCIKCHCDLRSGATFPSVTTISSLTGLCRATVIAALDDLEGAGHLERAERRRGQAARYRVVERVPLPGSDAVGTWLYTPLAQSAQLDALAGALAAGALPAEDERGEIRVEIRVELHQHQHIAAGGIGVQAGRDAHVCPDQHAALAWLRTLPAARRVSLAADPGWEVAAWIAAGRPA